MRRLVALATAALLASCGNHTSSKLAATSTELPAAAPTSADLVVEFDGAATVHDGLLSFSLAFKNIGLAMDAEVPVNTKAMLFPKADYANQLVGKGIVLDTIISKMKLGAGEAKTVAVEVKLPNVPHGNYFLGATTNSGAAAYSSEVVGNGGGGPILFQPLNDAASSQDAAPATPGNAFASSDAPPANPIASNDAPPADPVVPVVPVAPHLTESYAAQLNNCTPKLLDLGTVENAVAAIPATGKYDLQHEVKGGSISTTNGTAQHESRNILRVNSGEATTPEYAQYDHKITARFLFADLDTGTLSMGAYTTEAIDKVWYAISWGAEKDAAGNSIYVDYYSNAPSITHLKQGHYVMGVLSNVADMFALDSDPSNDLDLTYMELGATSIVQTQDEVWVDAGGEQVSIYASAAGGNFNVAYKFTYTIDNKPDWLNITVSEDQWEFYGQVVVDALHVPLGLTSVPVTIKATKDGVTSERVTTLKIFKNEGPVAQITGLPANNVLNESTPNFSITMENGIKTLHYQVNVVNAGTSKLYYSVLNQNAALKIETPEVREVAPGQSQVIKMSMKLVGIPIPANGESSQTYLGFTVMSNGGQKQVGFSYQIGGGEQIPVPSTPVNPILTTNETIVEN